MDFLTFSVHGLPSDAVVSRPQTMELTASDELLAMEMVDVLRLNGFEVEGEADDEGECRRLQAQVDCAAGHQEHRLRYERFDTSTSTIISLFAARFGGTNTPHEGSSGRSDGKMFEG